MAKERVLVTGASGFVGRALCVELAGRGYRVRAASRNVSTITSMPAELICTPDIGDGPDWSLAVKEIDVVVHLAARVHVMRDDSECPLAAFRAANVVVTERLARAAALQGVRRLIFASSIKVNGERTQHGVPYTPDDDSSPIDPYAVSKLEAERTLRQVATETGMEIVIIRPVLIYGPGVRANFRSLMHWLDVGMPLPLGGVRNQRSFVALDNLIDLIITCLNHPNARNETFLVSDGEDLSTPSLLRRMSAALGRRARLFTAPTSLMALTAHALGKTEIASRLLDSLQVDISKTTRLLEWKPRVSVDEALMRTADDFLAERHRRNK